MSNIQLHTNTIPAKAAEIFHVLDGKLVRDLSDKELFDVMIALVTEAYTVSGHNLPEGQELTYFVTSVQRDIQAICKTFPVRVTELPIAFNRGVRKEYFDYIGLPVIRFGEFLNKYLSHPDRNEALANRHAKIEPRKEPTEEEKFQTAKELSLKAYSDTKEGKDITLYGRVVYDFLDGLKLIEFLTEEKKAFYAEAKRQIIKENHIKVTGSVDLLMIKRIKGILESIEGGGEKELIISRSKVLALVSYLQALIFEEIELNLEYKPQTI
jgi:hypothetical protein